MKLLAYLSVTLTILAAGLFAAFNASPVNAANDGGVVIGAAAPDFETLDTNGNPFKLSDHKGKLVVLEWTNHQCPFVWKHYSSGNMQATQKAAAEKGVEWVSIVSSGPGRQGNVDADQANKIVDEQGATITAKILDETGVIGKMYDAKTTPHMFIINEEGNVVYEGAIDDNSSPDPKTTKTAKNYVLAALDNIKAGEPIAQAQTRPYGCSVKY